jgi:lipopolysaccharide/colanic/teichoic acid biosynthesis glycosyltransferase
LALHGQESSLVVRSASGHDAAATAAWPQRCFDLVLVAALTPIACLAGLAIALAVYLDSPGPVIYRSWRVGRGGRRFAMLKFRKMRREAPSHPVTLENDERFTPIGRFLAATRLDELPQLVNVLRGEMRLVGPRPELEYFVTRYAEEYAEILTVTPGLTGNAQLRFLGEKSLLSGPEPEAVYTEQLLPAKIEIDLRYARGHTLGGDLAILARTAALPAALLARGVRGHARWLRAWLPAVCCGVALGLAFVLLSSHLPS